MSKYLERMKDIYPNLSDIEIEEIIPETEESTLEEEEEFEDSPSLDDLEFPEDLELDNDKGGDLVC